jgi:tetratricopeptide (TPR) repeat protein
MSIFQLLMLGASAYFAFKIYEHIQTLQEPQEEQNSDPKSESKSVDTFSPFSPEALVLKADKAFEEKSYEKALAFLTEADAKEPNNGDILFKIAFILQEMGNNIQAIKYYKEALAVDKNNEYIHNAMASIYRSNGEFTSAKIHLKASLDIDNQNPITYYNYGNLLVDMQNYEEAMQMYKKAIELKDDFEEAKAELKLLEEKTV